MRSQGLGDGEVGSSLLRLATHHGLSEAQIEQLATILRSLAGDQLAPTSVREPAHAVDVHIADSLAALELKLVREAVQVADIGAGAGFPGLPLAAALPHSNVKLVESQARKCAFIERVAVDARIKNAKAICVRAEEWPEGLGAHDVVLARAVAPQPIVLEYAAPLLRLGGGLVDWRGRRDLDEESAALRAADALGLERKQVRRVEPFEGVRDHHLHVFLKVGATPDRFPRRAGVARKRPLAR